MKSIIAFTFASLLYPFSLFAQPFLYGTNPLGNGTIVEYDVATNSPKIHYSFANDGLSPFTLSELTSAGNGIYYGSTPRGGQFGGGVIFKFDSASRAYTILYNFNAPIAEFPSGKLLLLANGKLYGIARGNNVEEFEFKQTKAVIFSFDVHSLQLEILYHYEGRVYPVGNLVEGIDKKLYGNTPDGIFSFNIITHEYEMVHVFEWYTGSGAMGGLTTSANGKLYGLTSSGGKNILGVLFSYDPVTDTYSVEHHFNMLTAGSPSGTLTREYNDILYGTAYYTIFSFNVKTKEIIPMFNLDPDNDYPQHPYSFDLALGNDGKLYGMDKYGFYSFYPTTREYKHLLQSTTDLSTMPLQTFVSNDTGLLAVNPSSSSYELIKRLNAPVGIIPQSEIIKGSDGNFYGATTKSGKHNFGGIFSFDPITSTAKMLIDFDAWVIIPSCPLVEGLDKNLYYTTEFGGGPENYSRLVRYNKSLHKIEILHQFPTYTEGIATNGPLELGKDGYLYGVTDYIGSFGIIYRYVPAENRFEIIGDLGASYSIRFGKNGKLYGLTESIIQSIYSFDTSSKVLKSIPIPQNVYGGQINHRLTMDSAGSFYTSGEGNNNILKFDPITESFSKIITLDFITGNKLSSPLMISSKNILYGITHYREYMDFYEPPAILQLISVDPSSGILTPLTFLEGVLTFKPSLLLEEKPGSNKILATIEDTFAYESDQKATVKIILNKPAESSFQLNYKTIPGTASSTGSHKDFIAKSGSVKFSKGSVTGTIQVILKKDKIKEPDETFSILLSKPSIANDPLELKNSVATVTIKDGDRKHGGSHEIIVKGKNLIINHSNKALVAFVYPNPSSNYFTLMAHSKNYNHQIQMMVTDGLGRLVETKSFSSYQLIRFGDNYRKGIYYVQLIQDKEKIVLKLIKS